MSEQRPRRAVSQERVTFWIVGLCLSIWPFFALHRVNVDKLSDGLLMAFPIFAGFLTLALTLQRDAGWLQRQNWRRVNIERRLAESTIGRQVLLLFGYILTFVLMMIARALGNDGGWFTDPLTRAYLFVATLTMYATLFLPWEIKRMRVLPYDDVIEEKLEPMRRAA
jgi:hypothetical protein